LIGGGNGGTSWSSESSLSFLLSFNISSSYFRFTVKELAFFFVFFTCTAGVANFFLFCETMTD